MNTEQGDKALFGLKWIFAALFRHRAKMLAFFFATVIITGLGSYLSSKVYESKCRILYQASRQPLQVGAILTPLGEAASFQPDNEIQTEVQIFRSPLVVDRLVQEIGATRILEKMRWRWDQLFAQPFRWLEALKSWIGNLGDSSRAKPSESTEPLEWQARQIITEQLRVDPIQRTKIFELKFRAPEPEFAAEVLNKLVEIYLEHHLRVRQPTGSTKFFAEEAEQLRQQLRSAEEQLQSFKERWSIVEIEPQKQLLLQRLSESEAALRSARAAIQASDQRVVEIQRQLAAESKAIELTSVSSRNPTLDQLVARLTLLEMERNQYLAGSSLANQLDRKIDAVRRQMRSKKDKVSELQTSGVNQTYQELKKNLILEKATLKGIESRLQLSDRVNDYREQLSRLDQLDGEYKELQRDVQLKEEALKLYLRRHEEFRINQLLDNKKISNVVLIEAASIPMTPVEPKKMRNIMIGILGGIIGALALALISDYFRRSFVTKEEVEEILDQPVLSVLPLNKKRSGMSPEGLTQIRHLGECLQRANRDRAMHSVFITSTFPGEGKTYLAKAVARRLGQQKSLVLFIDATSLYHAFERNAASENNCEHDGKISEPMIIEPPNLYRLRTAGDEGIVLERWRRTGKILTDWKIEFDFIVIDGTALGDNPEGVGLASVADGVVLVIEAARTPAAVTVNTVRTLKDAGSNLLGAVVNKHRDSVPSWLSEWFPAQQIVIPNR